MDDTGEQTVLVPDDDEDSLSPHVRYRKAYFGRSSELMLYIMETDQHIRIPLEANQSVTIGRENPENKNHIDLTEHNAADFGVSRKHVRLLRSPVTITLEELGAKNGTYINGEKISQGSTQVLCDGDELRLGKMLLAVVFQKKST